MKRYFLTIMIILGIATLSEAAIFYESNIDLQIHSVKSTSPIVFTDIFDPPSTFNDGEFHTSGTSEPNRATLTSSITANNAWYLSEQESNLYRTFTVNQPTTITVDYTLNWTTNAIVDDFDLGYYEEFSDVTIALLRGSQSNHSNNFIGGNGVTYELYNYNDITLLDTWMDSDSFSLDYEAGDFGELAINTWTHLEVYSDQSQRASQPIPEPMTLLLFGSGLLGLFLKHDR